MPERIQLRRTKGWRKPENTIVVSRPSKWGNPFKVGEPLFVTSNGKPLGTIAATDPDMVVYLFRRYIDHYKVDVSVLRGKNLACWCALDQPCHADVLLALANGQP